MSCDAFATLLLRNAATLAAPLLLREVEHAALHHSGITTATMTEIAAAAVAMASALDEAAAQAAQVA